MSAADGFQRSGDDGPADVAAKQRRARRRSPVLRTILWVAVLVVVANLVAGIWTRYLWFDQLGFGDVYDVQMQTRITLFVGVFVVFQVLLRGSIWLAYRFRPLRVPDAAGEAMHRYRVAVEPFRRASFAILPMVLSVLVAVSAADQWQVPLLWWARQDFGTTDPQFGKDIGFYVFSMPLIEMAIGFATIALVMALMIATITHYVYGGILLRAGAVTVTRLARNHVCLLAIALLSVRAAAWWWGRYALVYRTSRGVTGIDDTGVRVTLPVHAILVCAAVITALAFVVTMRTHHWRLPIAATSMLAATAVVFGGVYPDVVAQLRDGSSIGARHAVYAQRSLDATRAAFGISDVTVRDYRAGTVASTALAGAAGAVPVLDPDVVTTAFQRLEGLPVPSAFVSGLDAVASGNGPGVIPTVVGARGIDVSELPEAQRNWTGQHVTNTHGTGLVTARANCTNAGKPSFVTDAAAQSSRFYFGRGLPDYSVITGKPIEADGRSSTGYRYGGSGGVAVGGPLQRLAFAVTFRSMDLLTSGAIDAKSKIIYQRDPVDRVRQVAPWLSVDNDAYPVRSGGKTVWVVDGYTTSARYPYSQHQSIPTASGRPGPGVNYLRGAVKATVDAYDGTVKLYAWDETDPILRAWMKVFPGTVAPFAQLPNDVRSQVRYPRGQFAVQRAALATHHTTDGTTFAKGQDPWRLPLDPTTDTGAQQPATYQPVTLPGAAGREYSLTSTYVDGSDNSPLRGYLAVGSDAGSAPGKVGPGYGRLTVLRVSGAAAGPAQFQKNLNASTQTSSTMPGTLTQFFTAQSRQKAQLIRGNLLTLPAAGGMLHVEPLYVRAAGKDSYPLLKAVVAGYGGKLRWGSTLQGALADLSVAH